MAMVFAASMGAMPVAAQQTVISDDQVVAECLAAAGADTDGCAIVIAQLVSQLRAAGLPAADIDARIRVVAIAVVEAAQDAGISGGGAVRIGEALRVAAAEVTDSELRDLIIVVAQAEETGQDFQTAATALGASPN